MRLRGTGTAPDGQYPKGQIFDAQDSQAAELTEKGWAERLTDPLEDPGRSEIGIAQGLIRGDTLNHPDDAAVAAEFQGGGTDPTEGKDPHAVVAEQDPAAISGADVEVQGGVNRIDGDVVEGAGSAVGGVASVPADEVLSSGDAPLPVGASAAATHDQPVGTASDPAEDDSEAETPPETVDEAIAAKQYDAAVVNVTDLEAEVAKRQADGRTIEVTGTGSNGNVVRDDLVKALQADDEAQAAA
jgi:hypothetical protein